VFLNVPTMPQPEACQFIRGFMNAFAEWVADYEVSRISSESRFRLR